MQESSLTEPFSVRKEKMNLKIRAESEAKGRAEGRADMLKEVLEKMISSAMNEQQARKIWGM